MSTPATTEAASKSPQEALNLLYGTLEHVVPHLPEPLQGATQYAVMIARNPKIDDIVCEQVGKVVHIVSKMAHPIGDQKITLRGNLGKLAWDKDLEADSTSTNETHTRTFTFSIPTAQMNQELEFKVRKGSDWSVGENWKRDMQSFGLIARIEVTNVAF